MGNQKLHLKTQRNQLMRQAIIVTLLVSTLLTFAQTVTVSPHRSRKFLSANDEMPAVVDTVDPTYNMGAVQDPTLNMNDAPAPTTTNNMGGGQNAMDNMGDVQAPTPTNNMGGGQNAMDNMGSAPAPVNNADQMQVLDTQMYNPNQMQGMGGQTLAMNDANAMEGMGTETPVVNAEPTQEMNNQINNANNMKDMGGQFDTKCPQGTPQWLCPAYHLSQHFTFEQIEAHARRVRCTMEYFAKEYPNMSFSTAVRMVDQNLVVFTSPDFCNGNPVMEVLTRYIVPETPFVEVSAGFRCIASQISHKVGSMDIGEITAYDALGEAVSWMKETPTVKGTHIVAPCPEHNNLPAVNQEQADMNLIGFLAGFAETEKHRAMQSERPKLKQEIQLGICIFNLIDAHFQGQQHTLGEVNQWVEFGGLHEHTCGN